MNRSLRGRFRPVLFAFLALVGFSVTGYIALEHYSLIDAVYMTVITLTTVGFGEVRPLSPLGRVFTTGVILMGVGMVAYFFSTLTDFIVTGEFQSGFQRRQRMRAIHQLHDHFLICGYGRVGERVASELQQLGLPFVVVDRDPAAAVRCEQLGFPFLQGDAEQDDILHEAGIDRARGLVTVLSSDADNVFVVLSARALKRDLLIVARATTEAAERKLLKAGANRVVSPYVMAGNQIVGLLVRPHVVTFLDRAMLTQELGLWLEEVEVGETSALVGQTLAEADVRKRTGATVLAIVVAGEKRAVVTWSPEFRLHAHDVLILLGEQGQIEAAAQLAADLRAARPSRLHRLEAGE